MKRYLLFMAETYYPSGGWEDFIGEFDTIDEAAAVIIGCDSIFHGFAQIVDTETKTVIEEWERPLPPVNVRSLLWKKIT